MRIRDREMFAKKQKNKQFKHVILDRFVYADTMMQTVLMLTF